MCGCLSHTPNWGPSLQPRHMPWLGIKPASHWFTGWYSVHLAIPARVLNTKFGADLFPYSLSHFECDSHTHSLTQRHLLPPLTSIVKSSLFIYAHSSPLSLAVRLQRCCANCSNHPHIDNGWTFSGQKYIMYGPGGKHKARGPNPALHLVLSGPTPCFYPVAVPSSHLTVKE